MSRLGLLGYAANLLLPLAASALCAATFYSPELRRAVADHLARTENDLRYLQVQLRGTRLLLWQFGAASILLLLAIALASPWPLPVMAATLVAPTAWLARQRRQRTTRIEEQLDTWLLVLANALRASPSLGEGIAASTALVARPLSEEMALLTKENQLGVPLDRALYAMAQRISSPVFAAAVATLRIARETGGDLSRTLEVSAASLREMARLEGVVRTKTAEGRAQAAVICIIPVPLVYLLHSIDPHLLAPLWSTPTGHLVVAAAVLLWAAALLMARKIVAVDV